MAASFVNQNQPFLVSSCSISATDSHFGYERIREENIRRNRDFFQQLGLTRLISQSHSISEPKLKSKSRPKPKPHSEPPAPLRRSTRKRSAPFQEDHKAELRPNRGPDPTPSYVDSCVFQYACLNPDSAYNSFYVSPSSSYSPAFNFKIVGKSLHDPSLSKIYTLDVSDLGGRDPHKVLVAAGGSGGFISVYGTTVEDQHETEVEEKSEFSSTLMGWKGSYSWISGISFVDENPMMLVSSSNDGGLAIWDISKQSPASSSPPPIVSQLGKLHSRGIFSMHSKEDVIATASKDSSVGTCRIHDTSKLVKERSISGHHSGVVRGICFRDGKYILADCGADGQICVLDTRLPEPCTLTIYSDHCTGINAVEWSPSNEFLLLSASCDPTLLLYDIRSPTEPIHKLRGHVESNCRNQIYKPTFVGNGTGVATPGQGSNKITVYSVEIGKMMSQGTLGYDANLVRFTIGNTGKQRLWAAGKNINQLCPVNLP